MITVQITRAARFNYSPDTNQPYFWMWLIEHFGNPDGRRWFWDSCDRITFVHEEDVTLFSLYWATDIIVYDRISKPDDISSQFQYNMHTQ